MITKNDRRAERERRHLRVRRKISGTAECPRLCVFRSNSNLYVQVIDDVNGNTLVQIGFYYFYIRIILDALEFHLF